MRHRLTEKKILKYLCRFIDFKQPEVKWSTVVSILLNIVLGLLSLHFNFTIYENDICSLIQCIISGLVSLIGIAIAGIAIVIALFTAEQIKIIDKLKNGAFDELLYDFQWLALVSAAEVAVFIALLFVIRSPYPVVHWSIFYLITFVLTYGVFYLLFYACALVGNFIKMAKLKCSLDTALTEHQSTSSLANEVQLDFLVSKLFHGDKQASSEFYCELISLLEKSSMNKKDEIVDYLKRRYTNL